MSIGKSPTQYLGVLPQNPPISITAQDGTGFTLTSTGNETSTFNWWIINA